MVQFLNFVILIVIGASFVHGNTVPQTELCGGRVFVEDAMVIDVPFQAGCTFEFETDEDRILAFSVVGATFQQLQDVLSIHDGLEDESPILLLENQKVYEVSNKNLPSTVYSTKSLAKLQLKKVPTSPLQLKIQKAVSCPFNLGAESQCGRVVDEISCYCALFTKRNWQSQFDFCKNNGMLLWSIEGRAEEVAVETAWGTTTQYWISLTDAASEGNWIWKSTNQPMYPGYANWAPGEPNSSGGNEDCALIGWVSSGAWNDSPCGNLYDAICEAH